MKRLKRKFNLKKQPFLIIKETRKLNLITGSSKAGFP